jgi:hypothetical protein
VRVPCLPGRSSQLGSVRALREESCLTAPLCQATHVYRSIGTATALVALLLAVCYAAELAQDVLEQAQAATPRTPAASARTSPGPSPPLRAAPPPAPVAAGGSAPAPLALPRAATLGAEPGERRDGERGDSDAAR